MDFDLDYLTRQLPALRAGLVLTVQASALAILISIAIGLLGASFRVLRLPVLAHIVVGYVEFIRNTPILVQIFFVFFGLPTIGLQLSLFWSGVVALALWAGAFQTENVRGGLAASLKDVTGRDDALARVDQLLKGYYDLFLDEPVTRDIWSGTQSDKALQELDIEDSRENAKLFFDALKHLVPKRDHARFEAASFLLMQLSGAAVRLAIAVERKQGDRLIAEYRGMMRRELESLLGP